MYLTLLGPTGGNSAHCRYLSAGKAGLLLDAGLDPLKEGREALPDTALLDRHEDYYPVHAILLSHAHMDHMAALPVLSARWPSAPILCTEATWRLTRLQLCRHATLWSEAWEGGEGAWEPLYGPADVQELEGRVRFVERGERINPVVADPELFVTAYDAGHILGSCAWLLEAEGQSLYYTADICGRPQSVIQGAVYPVAADTVVSACTVAWSERHASLARREEILRLADCIREVAGVGGSILMPVFNMGRAQELLYILHSLKRKGRIPPLPVYLGRRAWEIAQLYDQFAARDRRLLPDFKFLETMVDVLEHGGEEELSLEGSRIFLVPSGMMQPGSPSWRLARRLAPLPLQAIFFVGHAAGGSFAKSLLQAKAGDLLSFAGQAVPLHCRVESFLFPSHSSLPELLDMLRRLAPRRLVLLPGRKDSVERLSRAAREQDPALLVEAALPGEELDLGLAPA
jgi:cleavage and polyadenylation specificity factor subunit 3